MQYRKFGSTGVNISTLGFGCMRFPSIEGTQDIDEEKTVPMLRRAYELGVNYFDSAFFYCNGNSEVVLGKAVKPFRDKINISTKIPVSRVGATSDYRSYLEKSLKKLDTDYIDFYHFWSINKQMFDDVMLKYDLLNEALKAKEEGLIKHISFSFHGDPNDLEYIIAKAPMLETMLIQYNILDRSNEKGIEYVASTGRGVVAMGPVGGGRLAAPTELADKIGSVSAKATYELALRFVLGNPNISCALSGMRSTEEVEKNAKVMSSDIPFTEKENAEIRESLEDLKKFSDLYCTGCRYCMPCVKNIDIPQIFYLYTLYNVYGLKDHAKALYKKYREDIEKDGKEGLVTSCVECGACEKKCPQKLQIREKLKLVHSVLS
ncbi:MAG: aldo/keto reductase [Clostridia bacterium]|nr:aldo/keto reductase [Clostridia bacterium]